MSRFWPVCAVYLAYLFFHMTVRMFLNTRSYITAQSADTVSPATSRLTTMLECISGNLEPYEMCIRDRSKLVYLVVG